MFFAIGFVILVPLMFSVASKAKVSFIYLGIPLVAALSVTHGLLPPHPAPAAIAQEFGIAMGEVIIWGLVLSVPTIILAGPLFASTLKGIRSASMASFIDSGEEGKLPGIGVSLFCTLLPVALLMLEVIAGGWFLDNLILHEVIVFLSHPLTAMLISTIVVMYLLEIRRGSNLSETMKLLEEAIKGIALILLIIGGAGALNEVFREAGFNNYLAELLKAVNMSPILLCWSIAALIRISVGSATLAAITTAGILGPIYASGETNAVLLVLSIGSGSIIFSHVNDGGFWLFKEYFNLSIKETLLTWSLMETIIALSGLAGCLILNMFI
jgi:Gnt-I system high-affinity gluconate transporter